MKNQLASKVAIVTGGSSGIGLAIATRFVNEGATVYITGRRKSELDAAVAAIGPGAIAIQADVTKLSDLDAAYRYIREQSGRLDVVVANAGILEKAVLGEMTEAHYDRLFATNVKGAVFTVQGALPLMPAGSNIILMSSVVANKGPGKNSLYAGTKAAIRSFARGWVTDLKERRIRVNVISPGPVDTPGLASGLPAPDMAPTVYAQMATTIPSGRLGTAADITEVAVFLASETSSFINGADFQVDGGWAQI